MSSEPSPVASLPLDITAVDACRMKWLELMELLKIGGISPVEQDEWWERLLAHYTEPVRHYHTITHIHDMLQGLQEFEACKCLPRRVDLVMLAIYFHDIIYDPTSSTNEEDSADLYLQFATALHQDTSDSAEVSDWILVTKTHRPPSRLNPTDTLNKNVGGTKQDDMSYDMDVLLDLDLAVLSRPVEGYREYARQIRQEYAHVPVDKYCKGRAAILKDLAGGGESLYRTSLFREAGRDGAARRNLLWEVSLLERGELP